MGNSKAKSVTRVLDDKISELFGGNYDSFDTNLITEQLKKPEDFLSFADELTRQMMTISPADFSENKRLNDENKRKAKELFQQLNKEHGFVDEKTIQKEKWFEDVDARPDRTNSIKICYLLAQNNKDFTKDIIIDEKTGEKENGITQFLTKACQQNPFSMRNAEEIIHLFCLKNGLTYADAEREISNYSINNNEKLSDQFKSSGKDFTKFMNISFDSSDSFDTLIEYLTANREYYDGFSHSAYIQYGMLRESFSKVIKRFFDEEPGFSSKANEYYKKNKYVDGYGVESNDLLSWMILLPVTSQDWYGEQRTDKWYEDHPNIEKRNPDKVFDTNIIFDISKDIGKTALQKDIKKYDAIYKKIASANGSGSTIDMQGETIDPIKRDILIILFIARFFFLRRMNALGIEPPDHVTDNTERHKYIFEEIVQRLNLLLFDCGMSKLYVGYRFDFLVLASLWHDNPYVYFNKVIECAYYNSKSDN